MAYYAAMKKNEQLLYSTTWMNLTKDAEPETSEQQKSPYPVVHLYKTQNASKIQL